MRHTYRLVAGPLLLALLAAGCSRLAELKPSPFARRVLASLDSLPRPTPTPLDAQCKTVPTGLIDEFGYPVETVDKTRIIDLLASHAFGELDSVMDSCEAACRRDYHYEYLCWDAHEVFRPGVPGARDAITAWMRAMPASASALTAMACWYADRAGLSRGRGWIRDVPPDSIKAMEHNFDSACDCALAALRLAPSRVYPHAVLLRAALCLGERRALNAAIKRALRINPCLFAVRLEYMNSRRPRWGGTYWLMQRSAMAAQKYAGCNRKLRCLLGYCDVDRGSVAELAGQRETALHYYSRALRSGRCSYYLMERGDALRRMGAYSSAYDDFTAVLQARPHLSGALTSRASVSLQLALRKPTAERLYLLDEARGDVAQALLYDPASEHLAGLRERVAWMLAYSKTDPRGFDILGNWRIVRERTADGQQKPYDESSFRQLRLIRPSTSTDYVRAGAGVDSIIVRYRWRGGYFVTNAGGNSPYQYGYKVSLSNDTLTMSEVDPDGRVITRDEFVLYPGDVPPAGWAKR